MTISRLQSAAQYLGMIAVMTVISVTAYPRSAEAAPAADKAAATMKVTVSLSPEMARKAAPDDVVFIFARAAQGPRMPLAIVRAQVKDLPTTVVLDDTQAMSPGMNLSSVPEVVVVARVSKSGDAKAQNGDLEGTSAPLKVGTKTVTVNIANVLADQKTKVAPHVFR
jgi:cytochrome c-type biogenesis protein CcmH